MNQPNDHMNQMHKAVEIISLARMSPGQAGMIVQIDGGRGLSSRLDGLGIRVGKKITKVSGQLMRGPVLLRQDNIQVALGFGMACRVLVEVPRRADRK